MYSPSWAGAQGKNFEELVHLEIAKSWIGESPIRVRVLWLSCCGTLARGGMNATMSDTKPTLPPHVQMIQMGTAYWVSSLVYTAAKIDLAGLLADGPKSADDLAGPTKANPRALYRFMRTLASFGILTLRDDGTFGLTELGATLKRDAPGCRPRHRADAWRPGVLERVSRVRLLARNRQAVTGPDDRNGGLRLSRTASRRGVALQRDDGRHPWRRAARGCRGLRLFVVRHDRRCRRRHRQHARAHPDPPSAAEGRPVRPPARRRRRAGAAAAPAASPIASRSKRATSSTACPKAATPTSCRTSSTTGPKRSATPSSATAARR